MFPAIILSVALLLQGQPAAPAKPVPQNAPATLPASPQGKAVKTYLDAFNAGDEAKFLDAQEKLLTAEALAKRSRDQRAAMYKRMRGDFATLKVLRAVAEADQIRLAIPDKKGTEATFAFDFEAKAPFKMKGLSINLAPPEK